MPALDEADLALLEVCSSDTNVDTMYDTLHSTMFNACDKCGIVRNVNPNKTQTKTKQNRKKPWFSYDCHQAKKNLHMAKKLYKNNKTNQNLANVKAHCKGYKSTLRKAKKKYKKHISDSILHSRSQDPKTCWSYINGRKPKPGIPVPLNELKEHFEKLSTKPVDESDEAIEDNLQTLLAIFEDKEITNSVLNSNFTIEELYKIIKKLKPNKSAGPDGIINEVIIHTFDKLKTFWCSLFNRILHTAELPAAWLNGSIVPIYKNKGDKTDLSNYRGITFLSCSAKFFTAVLNKRMRTFSDTCEVLLSNQAGFRPNHSTTDNLFVLKTLSDIVRHRIRKLYCAYVDYEKAFDKVWHTGLWTKLLKYGNGGKLIQVLIKMYKGITSCVSAHNSSSNRCPDLGVEKQHKNVLRDQILLSASA